MHNWISDDSFIHAFVNLINKYLSPCSLPETAGSGYTLPNKALPAFIKLVLSTSVSFFPVHITTRTNCIICSIQCKSPLVQKPGKHCDKSPYMVFLASVFSLLVRYTLRDDYGCLPFISIFHNTKF